MANPALPQPVVLDGGWRAADATDETRRAVVPGGRTSGTDSETPPVPGDESTDGDGDGDGDGSTPTAAAGGLESWVRIDVPGHWQQSAAFAGSDGPVLYVRDLDLPPPTGRAWLVLDGVFHQSDVWWDGTYLGDTEGGFTPHRIEIPHHLLGSIGHRLVVEVACPNRLEQSHQQHLTGAYQSGPHLDPQANPGGIWRPPRIEVTGPTSIRRHRVVCTEATVERAVVSFQVVLDALEVTSATIRAAVGDVRFAQVVNLAQGENHVEWTVPVDQPQLWWPHSLGEPVLHDATIDVVDQDGRTSDTRRMQVGLRSVDLRGSVMSINAERLFLKGASYGPTRQWAADATADDFAADLRLAGAAGLDLLRIHAHVAPPEWYAAADAAGMLLWQELPLRGRFARTVRRRAMAQAEEMLDLLAHHPSIVIWSARTGPAGPQLGIAAAPATPAAVPAGASKPAAGKRGRGRTDSRRAAPRRGRVARAALAQQFPDFNRTVLDRSLARVLRGGDPSRPVVASSGSLPHLPTLTGTDTHLSLGWAVGSERTLPRLAATLPRLVGFVGEFGAQSVPHTATFCEPERWPDLDWEGLAARHNLDLATIERHTPPDAHATFDGWRAATQGYQAQLVRRHVEELRRLKYRPTGGFAVFCLVDGHPGITWSLVDHERVPKAAYAALAEACAPVIVVADRLPERVRVGEALALDVHVVSDLRHPLTDVVATARLSWPGGGEDWRWQGDIGADACQRVGTIQFVVPRCDGALELHLHATWGDGDASNHDSAPVVG